jgi:hypothetical protein
VGKILFGDLVLSYVPLVDLGKQSRFKDVPNGGHQYRSIEEALPQSSNLLPQAVLVARILLEIGNQILSGVVLYIRDPRPQPGQ